MTTRTRLGLWLLTMTLVALPALPAGAVLFCDSYCNCERSCTVKCWDGEMTTCGAASYPCAETCFQGAEPETVEVTLGLRVPTPPAADASQVPASPGLDTAVRASALSQP